MKRTMALLLAAALLTTLTACAGESVGTIGGDDGPTAVDVTDGAAESSWKTITAEEARARMDSGDEVVIVDVRTESEYEEGHVPGAILLPNEEIGAGQPEQLPDLDAELLIYCRSGRRSAEAAKKLSAMGYTNVSDFGGILDWPYETETGPAGDAGEAGSAEPTPPDRPGVLSSFATEDLEGNAVDSSILEGYPINMINVWATFCGPCINEMPDLGVLAEEYKEKGIQILGIVSDVRTADGAYDGELLDLARDIVEATGANYPHLLPSDDLMEAKLQSIQAVPTTFFVNDKGETIGSAYVVGAKSEDQWREILDGLLAEVDS